MRFLIALFACFLTFPAYAQSNVQRCCVTTAPSSYLGAVATRGFVNTTQDTTNRELMARTAHFAKTNIAGMQLVLQNFQANPNGEEGGQTNTSTIYAATVTASVEYPAGSCTQVKFSGSSTGNFTTGTATLLSDNIAVVIPNGAQFWVRQYYVGTQGATYSNSNDQPTTPQPGLGDAMHAGVSGIADQTISCGAVTDTGIGELFPLALLGTITQPSICIIGDSRSQSNSGVNAVGDPGEIAMTTGLNWGYINMGVQGTTAEYYIIGNTYRSTMYQYCSHAIVEYGINDLNTSVGNRTAAQLEGDLTTLYAGLYPALAAPAYVFQTTLPPETTSTDNWATTANQTKASWDASRVTFNSALRANTFGPIGGYFDVSSLMETSTNSGYWKNPGNGNFQCQQWPDSIGVHESLCAALQIVYTGTLNIGIIAR